MSVYVGIDVHRKRSQVAVVTEDGTVQLNKNVVNGSEPFLRLIAGLPAGTSVAFEAAFGWSWQARSCGRPKARNDRPSRSVPTWPAPTWPQYGHTVSCRTGRSVCRYAQLRRSADARTCLFTEPPRRYRSSESWMTAMPDAAPLSEMS